MPPKKRPYVPKTKGCYECSQRRIHCDRGKPQCQKCICKGLKCSGLGVRHRFNKGVASRGKWAGKAMDSIYRDEGRVSFQIDSAVKHVQSPRILIDDASTSSADSTSGAEEVGSVQSPGINTVQDAYSEIRDDLIFLEHEPLTFDWSALNVSESTPSMSNACALYQPFPNHIPRWKRNMLLHFSDHIAGEMVAIDGPHNGYRNLVLPFCEIDELVMNTVVTVSAFHLYLKGSPTDFNMQTALQQMRKTQYHRDELPDPNELYAQVILGLQQRQELENCDQLSKHSIFLTILVLFTGVMVTGSSDFPTLCRMLESALNVVGGDKGLGEGELAEFLMPQFHKMQVYAAPLLSEESGLEILSSPTHAVQLFDCLEHWSRQYPDHVVEVSFVMDLVQQARDIYLGQVRFRSTSLPSSTPTAEEISDSISRVQRFKETLEAFPHNSQGEQVLVWASFVAASDCLLDEHRAFFESVFLKHHARSGFGNLLRGMEYLRKIWARSPGERWTSLLPQARILVM